MSGSDLPGPLSPPQGWWTVPPRTCGPLGYMDQADPNVTSRLGNTPGTLGSNDWGDPALPFPGPVGLRFAGAPMCLQPGLSLSAGVSLAPQPGTTAAASTVLDWNDVRADFERWEGKVSHMYLDTKGLVTVGIGKMLPDADAAKQLAFVRRADAQAATEAEIEADFKEVSKQTKGKLASTYKQYTKLDLPDAEIDALLKTVVAGFEADLEANFTGYRTYPAAAKRALLDMIYNLGKAGLLKFKKLKAAVEAADWKTASEQCHRNGPSDDRNNWTRDQFLAAAK